MKYGVIGEHLKHSFSKEIHSKISDYVYEIKEISPENLEDFIKEKDFYGINVTIPYKEKVIPYLDFISDSAKKIGAVNTIVNRGGKLFGYNTDYMGMRELIIKTYGEIKDKKVLILGAGGTSKTAHSVVSDMDARNKILKVTRSGKDATITYDEAYKNHTDAQVIINTTPVGMYPENSDTAFDISAFLSLECVIDAVYNPIRTRLVQSAKERGIKAEAGLFMLSAQAVYASAVFTGKDPDKTLCEKVFSEVLSEKENIVLIGMPCSGKTTVGKELAKITGKKFVDTDCEIVKKTGIDIPTYFQKYGEANFRQLEKEVIEEISKINSQVIATGGGCILDFENVRNLRSNGKIYFLDRSLENLTPTSDRPLSSDKESLEKRYRERYSKYVSYADSIIDSNRPISEVANDIKGDFYK
ncbi:MAG: shikimate kinase [Eubacteriales bacterium]